MTCHSVDNAPLSPEPLPPYSRRDPDAISVHSAAPSYVSETPSYTSRRMSNPPTPPPSLLPPLSPGQQTRGLPAPLYAPGFQSRAHGAGADLSAHNYNMGSWSSTLATQNNSRQYHAVARRRASRAASTNAILNSLTTAPPPLPSARNASPTVSSTNLNAYPVTIGSPTEPVGPLEDPYLVGEVAAQQARTQRVYREMCARGEEAARYEGRSWEFMLGQMSDWREREQSWKNFRHRVGNTKLLGRRLGLRA